MSGLLPVSLRRYQRFSTRSAEKRLSLRLNLAWDEQMQDWDLTNANGKKLTEFLKLLDEDTLPDDESYSLMSLAVASADEMFDSHPNDEHSWQLLEKCLLRHPDQYVSLIWYWAEPILNNEEGFPISKRMAQLWKQVLPALSAE